MDKKIVGFTTLEIMVVLIILSILATLTLPYFTKTIEKSRGRLAKTNLEMIYYAEKVFRDKNESGCYYPDPPGMVNNLEAINQALNLTLKPSDFNYTILTTSCDGFRAQAERNSGRYIGWRISIDQTGEITEVNNP